MRATHRKDILNLSVTNYGPIIQADIDLRPITVFFGPNHSGKSYLAALIYALHRHFGSTRFRRFDERGLPGRESLIESSRRKRPALSDIETEFLFYWIETFHFPKPTDPHFPVVTLPDYLRRFTRSAFFKESGSKRQLDDEIRRCAGVESISHLVRGRTPNGARISLWRKITDETTDADLFRIESVYSDSRFRTKIAMDRILLSKDIEFEILDLFSLADAAGTIIGDQTIRGATQIANKIVTIGLRDALGPIASPAFFLPAARAGIVHAASAMSIGDATARSSSHDRPLPGTMTDFLQIPESRTTPGRPLRFFCERANQLARQIETEILGGEIRRAGEDRPPSFVFLPESGKRSVPAKETSAMVSELAPLVLYLRHQAEYDDVLIIEEPEAHLHPAMQAVLARVIARLAISGIRVVITTHSEWLLDQLANLVRLSALPQGERQGIEGAEDALRPEDFGAWLFKRKKRPRGSVVEEIKIDAEAGGLLTGYENVAEELYNAWAEIGNRAAEAERPPR